MVGVYDYIKTFKHNKDGLTGKWEIVVQVLLGIFIDITLYFSSDAVIRENTETYTGETVVVSEMITELHSSYSSIRKPPKLR